MAKYEASYGYTRTFKEGFDAILGRTVEALKTEGFGVITEIDVKQTMKNKLNAEFRKYKILGACNPPLAHKALSAELAVGLLLPCNVTVFEGDDGETVVQAIKPHSMFQIVNNPGMQPIVEEVDAKLKRVMERI